MMGSILSPELIGNPYFLGVSPLIHYTDIAAQNKLWCGISVINFINLPLILLEHVPFQQRPQLSIIVSNSSIGISLLPAWRGFFFMATLFQWRRVDTLIESVLLQAAIFSSDSLLQGSSLDLRYSCLMLFLHVSEIRSITYNYNLLRMPGWLYIVTHKHSHFSPIKILIPFPSHPLYSINLYNVKG